MKNLKALYAAVTRYVREEYVKAKEEWELNHCDTWREFIGDLFSGPRTSARRRHERVMSRLTKRAAADSLRRREETGAAAAEILGIELRLKRQGRVVAQIERDVAALHRVSNNNGDAGLPNVAHDSLPEGVAAGPGRKTLSTVIWGNMTPNGLWGNRPLSFVHPPAALNDVTPTKPTARSHVNSAEPAP